MTLSDAAAQTSRATIRGVVVDQTGARLAGVEIKVLREDTNEVASGVTDRQGHFAFPELPAGQYSIEARRAGFTVYRHRAELAVGQELWLEPELTVSTTATVTTGGADSTVPLLERNSPALATLIDQNLVANLPLDGRNFLELALLTPGTAPAPQGSASSVRGDFAFSTHGGREDFNSFVLDGVYNVDPKLNTPAVRPPVDGIREFEVATSSYDATFGRNAAGQVNVVTRSGSNTISGTRLRVLPERGALVAPITSRRKTNPSRNTSAISSGRRSAGRLPGTAPSSSSTTSGRGCVRASRGSPTCRPPRSGPAISRSRGSRGRAIRRAASRCPAASCRRSSSTGSVRRLRRSTRCRTAATPFANYVSSPVQRDDVHQFDVKVEHNLTGTMRLSARYSLSDRGLIEPFAGTGFATIPGFGNDVARRGQNLAISSTQAASRYVNDLRVGYNRVHIGVFPEDTSVTNASVGLPTLSSNPRDAGLSLISIAGYSPIGHEYNNPQESTSDTLQINDTVDRGVRCAPAQGRRRVVRHPPVGVSRRAGARLPHVRASRPTPAMRSPTCCSACRC